MGCCSGYMHESIRGGETLHCGRKCDLHIDPQCNESNCFSSRSDSGANTALAAGKLICQGWESAITGEVAGSVTCPVNELPLGILHICIVLLTSFEPNCQRIQQRQLPNSRKPSKLIGQ